MIEGRPLPPARTLLEAVDRAARETVSDAQKAIAGVVDRETPRRTGLMARALQPRVARTATGYSLLVRAPRGRRYPGGRATVADVVRYVNRGTGVYREGPGAHHKIRARNPLRRMSLGNGVVRRSVRGQRPNPFIARIRAQGDPKFEEIARAGADRVPENVAGALRT